MRRLIKYLQGLSATTILVLAALLIMSSTFLNRYEGTTGRLLVAAPGLQAPFDETVIYVARHDFGGALGFVVNAPLGSDAVRPDRPETWGDAPLYYGGPVNFPDSVFYLYERAGERLDITQTLAGTPDAVLLGFSGWAPLQLEYETFKGLWGVIDYDAGIARETEMPLIWDKARRTVINAEKRRIGKVL